jgi:sugar lactone lactonase YvrE
VNDDFIIGDVIIPINISKAEQMNDGKCDTKGRYWTGTLAIDRKSPVGALYCVTPNHQVMKKIDGAIVSNGLGWNEKQDKMFYIDTKKSAIFVLDYDIETGDISNQRVFVDLSSYHGGGDGMTVDLQDNLWVAMWDVGEIHCYDAYGKLIDVIKMPISRVTSCCFGGKEHKDLYVTSSKNGLTPEQLTEQPLAGSIFVIKLGIKGVETTAFAG